MTRQWKRTTHTTASVLAVVVVVSSLLEECCCTLNTHRAVPRSVDRCCDQLYLSASEGLATNQEGILGLYNWTGMLGDILYYTKSVNGRSNLYFFKKGGGSGTSSGWMVGGDLKGNSIYITTSHNNAAGALSSADCPDGIRGAYDSYTEVYDSSFSAECHNPMLDVSSQHCCLSVWVNSTAEEGPVRVVARDFLLGRYDLMATAFNGRPVYHMQKYGSFDAYLYFRKQGNLNKDGWVVATEIGGFHFFVGTGDSRPCPDGISPGFDSAMQVDETFSISCDQSLVSQVKEVEEATAKIPLLPTSTSVASHHPASGAISGGNSAATVVTTTVTTATTTATAMSSTHLVTSTETNAFHLTTTHVQAEPRHGGDGDAMDDDAVKERRLTASSAPADNDFSPVLRLIAITLAHLALVPVNSTG